MNVQHIYRITASGWVHIHDGRAEEIPPWPRLSQAAMVVLDMDDVPSEVWRFEGKAEYANALIEKRIRTEGLVEGVAHVVVHRLDKSPNGFQVFFSAVALETWQRLTQWASEQPDHCVPMLAAGLLCNGVKTGGARVLLSGRRLALFSQSAAGMTYLSAQALGQGLDALVGAAQLLGTNGSAAHKGPVDMGVLWADDGPAWDACAHAFADASGADVRTLPWERLESADGAVVTGMAALAKSAAVVQSLNAALPRLAWRAESWVSALTGITAVVAVGLLALGLVTERQADAVRQASLSTRAELEQVEASIQAVNRIQATGKLLPVVEFARKLDDGIRYDPLVLLATLKDASWAGIRIQRVQLQGGVSGKQRTYRIDAVAPLDATDNVRRFVSDMQRAGWLLKALDPTDTTPGAFSYELVAEPTPAKS